MKSSDFAARIALIVVEVTNLKVRLKLLLGYLTKINNKFVTIRELKFDLGRFISVNN
ncbi:hypothetical protein [Sphingobacterium bambusae]|uniref:Uncharacterized protein n=1 Tax=Sphingobacterium bambusae TaxID=662858 RepID=A0ABW6BAC6_9SPHI|nr:hypothetical protein [Sphingobacterium bambusae]WPL48667.1 hypothetical protein SCB77_22205 [Sphingobacterium bambusae]